MRKLAYHQSDVIMTVFFSHDVSLARATASRRLAVEERQKNVKDGFNPIISDDRRRQALGDTFSKTSR